MFSSTLARTPSTCRCSGHSSATTRYTEVCHYGTPPTRPHRRANPRASSPCDRRKVVCWRRTRRRRARLGLGSISWEPRAPGDPSEPPVSRSADTPGLPRAPRRDRRPAARARSPPVHPRGPRRSTCRPSTPPARPLPTLLVRAAGSARVPRRGGVGGVTAPPL